MSDQMFFILQGRIHQINPPNELSNVTTLIFHVHLREESNEQQLATLQFRDEGSAGVDIKLGDLMITPSKSLWKIICV